MRFKNKTSFKNSDSWIGSIKWGLAFFIIALMLSCGVTDMDQDPRAEGEEIESRDRNRSRDNDRADSRSPARTNSRRNTDRESELRRLRTSDNQPLITSLLENRYSGSFSFADYDDEQCEESSSCKRLCDDVFSKRYRTKCYRSPREFIEDLEEGLFTLLNISEVEEVAISPAFVNGVLNIDRNIFLNLVEDRMSEGGLKRFLTWLAINDDISQVFLEKDRGDKVLKAALEKLGTFQNPKQKSKLLQTGLNVGLLDSEDTFLSLAVDEDNEYGFEIAYSVLKSSCKTKDCKLEVLCARETRASRRSRIFGSGVGNCRTSTKQDRRLRSSGTCYVHGARVWSFLDEMIEDDDINDRDFKENPVQVITCNTFCGREISSNTKCSLVL